MEKKVEIGKVDVSVGSRFGMNSGYDGGTGSFHKSF
jgi:hypothetical protein